jgi:hypothetical protein
MIVSVRLLAIVAVVAVLGLSLKAALEDPMVYEHLEPQIQQAVRDVLEKDGYQLLPLATTPSTIAAFKNGCGLWIGTARPEGGADAAFISNYGSVGELAFWYRGALTSTRPPVYSVLADRYFERLRVVWGAKPIPRQLYHLILTPDCDRAAIEKLDLG